MKDSITIHTETDKATKILREFKAKCIKQGLKYRDCLINVMESYNKKDC
jgi:hypothetical protein